MRRKSITAARFHCSHTYRRAFRCLNASGKEAKFPKLCSQFLTSMHLLKPLLSHAQKGKSNFRMYCTNSFGEISANRSGA